MYVVYCQNKPKSEHIVSEYSDTYFEVRVNYFEDFTLWDTSNTANLHLAISLSSNLTFDFVGLEAAAGTQATDLRPAHQASPEDHEVPAAAQGWSGTIQQRAPEL